MLLHLRLLPVAQAALNKCPECAHLPMQMRAFVAIPFSFPGLAGSLVGSSASPGTPSAAATAVAASGANGIFAPMAQRNAASLASVYRKAEILFARLGMVRGDAIGRMHRLRPSSQASATSHRPSVRAPLGFAGPGAIEKLDGHRVDRHRRLRRAACHQHPCIRSHACGCQGGCEECSRGCCATNPCQQLVTPRCVFSFLFVA